MTPRERLDKEVRVGGDRGHETTTCVVGSKGASDEGKKLDAQLTGRVLGSPVQLLAGARGRVEVQNQPTTGATEPDDVCFASFGQLNACDTHSTILPLIAGWW